MRMLRYAVHQILPIISGKCCVGCRLTPMLMRVKLAHARPLRLLAVSPAQHGGQAWRPFARHAAYHACAATKHPFPRRSSATASCKQLLAPSHATVRRRHFHSAFFAAMKRSHSRRVNSWAASINSDDRSRGNAGSRAVALP